uniref:Uncharacterized protein n=1 Tax=Chelydra serpentina TaxID=8475 RepID=A0A8C3SAS6_CHESE
LSLKSHQFLYITCAEYTHFYGGKKSGKQFKVTGRASHLLPDLTCSFPHPPSKRPSF